MVIVYKCKYTDAEYMSDSFFPDKTDEYEGVIWAVNSIYIEKVDGFAAEDDEDVGPKKVLNIADQFYLEKTEYKKKAFLTWAGSYLKKVAKEFKDQPDEKKLFKSQTKKFMKFVIANFKEMDFYINNGYDEDGLVVPAFWGENATPVFYFIHAGLYEQKY